MLRGGVVIERERYIACFCRYLGRGVLSYGHAFVTTNTLIIERSIYWVILPSAMDLAIFLAVDLLLLCENGPV